MHTYTHNLLVLELPNPDFSDKLQLDTSAIVRRNRAGVVKTFRDSSWPQPEIYRYQYSGLGVVLVGGVQTQLVSLLLAFLVACQGDQVSLATGSWTKNGVIITDPCEIITERDDTFYSVALDFQVTP